MPEVGAKKYFKELKNTSMKPFQSKGGKRTINDNKHKIHELLKVHCLIHILFCTHSRKQLPSAQDLSFVEIQAIVRLVILRGCIRFREISFWLAYVACCQFPRAIAYANLPLTYKKQFYVK